VCVPTGHTLKIEIDGLRPYGVPAPGGGAGIMKHRVYVDGDSVATLAEETSTPEDCTLSNGTVNYTVEDAGLHCIHYECTSNGMWYNAGNVGFILEPDP
jgi:hypothetical protein